MRTNSRWRRWLGGPKHGIARGVAVWGTPGFAEDADALNELLGRWPKLTSWAESHGLALGGIPEDLQLLDQKIDEQSQYPAANELLTNELGKFLGTVIIRSGTGARWRVWPNGHPVIRTASGRELDVVALANRRIRGDGPRLADIYADAVADLQA